MIPASGEIPQSSLRSSVAKLRVVPGSIPGFPHVFLSPVCPYLRTVSGSPGLAWDAQKGLHVVGSTAATTVEHIIYLQCMYDINLFTFHIIKQHYSFSREKMLYLFYRYNPADGANCEDPLLESVHHEELILLFSLPI